jgi:hypothetical protein
MKDAKSIISHLVQQPSMKKYEHMRCFERLLGLLPKSFTSLVRFVYTKNETLFFVLSHPAGKMEFHYKRSLIKSLLSQIISHFPQCDCLRVKEIQCFVTHQREKDVLPESNAHITYEERATGNFPNDCCEPKLHALFEAIKETLSHHDAHPTA